MIIVKIMSRRGNELLSIKKLFAESLQSFFTPLRSIVITAVRDRHSKKVRLISQWHTLAIGSQASDTIKRTHFVGHHVQVVQQVGTYPGRTHTNRLEEGMHVRSRLNWSLLQMECSDHLHNCTLPNQGNLALWSHGHTHRHLLNKCLHRRSSNRVDLQAPRPSTGRRIACDT